MKTNIGHSVKSRLLNIAKETGKSYQQVLTRYFQERLLSRLSISPYKENFILKGGVLLYAIQKEIARPTYVPFRLKK